MTIIVALVFIIGAIVNAWQASRWMRQGEAFLIVSAGGDGIFGHTCRSENPVSFWFVIAFHFLISVGATALGIGMLLNWV